MLNIDITKEPHYKFLYLSLATSGLWPLQSSVKNKKFLAFSYTALISLFLPQFISITNASGKSFDALLESFAIFIWYCYIFSKYAALCLHNSQLTYMLNKVLDLKRIINKEVEIIEESIAIGRFYAILHIAYGAIGIISVSMVQVSVFAINMFRQSENRTQIVVFQNRGDYIIISDPFAMNIHFFIVSGLAIFFHEGFDVFFLMCAAHAVALMRILCYKLSNFGKGYEDSFKEIQLMCNSILRQEVKSIVQLHCEIYKFIDELEKTFCYSHMSSLFLCIILVPVTSFILQYYNNKPILSMQIATICLAFVFELLFLNMVGQRLIIESEQIIEAAYCSYWYDIPIEFRKSIRIIMLRSLNPIKLSAGKIIILSAETFTKAMRTVVSYYTLLLTIF